MLQQLDSHDRSSDCETHESFFLLNTQFSSSKAHPYGSDDIFPLELLYFFPRPNLSESGSWNFRVQETERERERRGKAAHERERRLICMSAPLSRQRGRPVERPAGEGEHSSSAFSKIADWLPPASAQEPGSRQHTFLPLIAADETLMLPLSSQHLAHAHSSDPSHSNVLWPTPACQTWAGLRSDTDRPRSCWVLP